MCTASDVVRGDTQGVRERGWGVLIGLLVVLGCGRSDGAGQNSARTDQDGLLTIIHRENANAARVLWSSEHLYDTDGDERLQLLDADFVSARFSPDSGLLITNVSEMVYRGPAGTQGVFLAGEGDGPNDFRTMTYLGVGNNQAPFVVEQMGRRISRIDWEGKRIGALSKLPLGDDRGRLSPVNLLGDSTVLTLPSQWRPNRGTAGGFVEGDRLRDSVMLVLHRLASGQRAETLAVWPGVERASGFIVPFTRAVVWSGRGAAAVVGITDSVDLRLYIDGAPKLRLVEAFQRHEASSADHQAWNRAVAEEMEPALVTFLKNIPGARLLPAVGGVVVDESANMWIGDYAVPGEMSRRWRVFSMRGELLGALQLPVLQSTYIPARTELLDVFGDRLAILREKPDGALFIEVRKIRR